MIVTVQTVSNKMKQESEEKIMIEKNWMKRQYLRE